MFDLETSPLSPMAAPLQADQLPTFKRGGMFGGKSGGIGEMIAAAINGYLAAGGNPAGQYGLQMLNQRRMMAQRQQQEDADYQRKRQDALTDYEAKQKIDQRYPNVPAPTEYERALQAAGILPGTPQWQQHMSNYVNMRENPPFTYVDPTTGAVMMGARAAPQQQLLDTLPPGAKPIGGAPGSAPSPTFPGY
jgi:hypothetical protein